MAEQRTNRAAAVGALARRLKLAIVSNADCGARAAEYVITINALLLPKYYVCAVGDMLHLVLIRTGLSEVGNNDRARKRAAIRELVEPSVELRHAADVIWHFEPESGTWYAVKDRSGKFMAACPIKLGGIPAVQRALRLA